MNKKEISSYDEYLEEFFPKSKSITYKEINDPYEYGELLARESFNEIIEKIESKKNK